MTDTDDPTLAFLAAAFAPAVVTGLICIALAGGWSAPGGLGAAMFLGAVAFVAAAFIAGLHIGLLAVPLHRLLNRRGPPGPLTILASATLIGALPVPLLFEGGEGAFMIFGFAGLIGGVAFLTVGYRPGTSGEDM